MGEIFAWVGKTVVDFQVVGTFRGAAQHMLSGITDFEVIHTDAGWRLYSTTRPGGGLLAMALGATSMSLLDQETLAAGVTLSAPARLLQAQIGGRDVLLVSGRNDPRLGGFALLPSGGIGDVVQITGSPAGTVAAQALVGVGGTIYAYVNRMGESTILTYRMDSSGKMALADDLDAPGAFQGVDVAAMQAIRLNGAPYLLTLSTGQEALRSYRIEADGGLSAVASVGAASGLGIATPSALEVVSFAGKTWVIVAGAGSSSISVVRVAANGGLTLTDHVVDTLDTRFQGVQALTTIKVGDRVFLFAGGGDDGVNLFTLLPDGRLLLLAEHLQTDGMALHNITALKAAQIAGGTIDLFVAGEGTGITRLQLDMGEFAPILQGGIGNDTFTGGVGNDLISGGEGDDRLFGGAGNDILMDGAGSDQMTGGAGADIFVMAGDGIPDLVIDFQVGIDRLDLSDWGRIYSLEALDIDLRPNGGLRIRYGDDGVVLYTSNGLPFPLANLTARDLFPLWHVVGPAVVPGVRIEGSAQRETLQGGLGDDTMIGSSGADVLDGRAGFDTVDYSHATTALIVDLETPTLNRGEAAGDRYIGIEGVMGGTGNDRLGGSGGANMLAGRGGRDLLIGRGGDDLLSGGADGDTLQGGAGADRLNGGLGTDWASYADAGRGVLADLDLPRLNSGDAAGDLYEQIEALEGSRFADTLAGDRDDNLLAGRDGADRLLGRSGADHLYGGGGDDVLAGDSGDDVLFGGGGMDFALFLGKLNVRVDLQLSAAQNTGHGLDHLREIEHLESGDGADLLRGNVRRNLLLAGGGNDTLFGLGGNDGLVGGAGADQLDGGTGDDLLDGGWGNDILRGGAGRDMARFSTGVSVRVDLGKTRTQDTGEGRDQLTGIEDVRASAGNDVLVGNGLGNALFGGSGDDQLSGGGGADLLSGDIGRDTLIGGLGNDTLQGGSDIDAVVYATAAKITLRLAYAGAQNTGQGMDQLSGVENAVTGAGADLLVGNHGDNRLSANGGNDRIDGGRGNDLLLGGAGNDTLIGGSGSDFLSGGGGGNDWALFTGSLAVRVDLNLRQMQNTGHGLDRLEGIEAVQSGDGADLLLGNGAANTLMAGAGRDTLRGGGGMTRCTAAMGQTI